MPLPILTLDDEIEMGEISQKITSETMESLLWHVCTPSAAAREVPIPTDPSTDKLRTMVKGPQKITCHLVLLYPQQLRLEHSNARDSHLIGGQSAGLVRADDGGAAQGFDRGQAADDGVLLCHLPGSQS